jgi:hypothetical protein
MVAFPLTRLVPAPRPFAQALGAASWTLYLWSIWTMPDDMKHGDAGMFVIWPAAVASWSSAAEAGRALRGRARRRQPSNYP